MSAKPSRAFSRAELFPNGTTANEAGHLIIGECDVSALAAEYGTPLYIYHEDTIRDTCSEYLHSFQSRLPEARVLYAAKAYLSPALAGLLSDTGIGMDVVSGGELYTALAGGFPAERMAFHGNNKSAIELDEALSAGIGRIVVDSLNELELLRSLLENRRQVQPIMLRVTPSVDAHTHVKTTTGMLDSKFGLPLDSGEAEKAVVAAQAAPEFDLMGFHIHLGSPISDLTPYEEGIATMTAFAAAMRDKYDYVWREFSPGGGFAVSYTEHELPPTIDFYAEAIATALRMRCSDFGLSLPTVHVEPGRSIIARSGVAVYSVGARKEIPGVRTYVAVDGGMADNIRPAMYGSKYTAVVANRVHDPMEETVSVAGKFCESGDVLINEIEMPRLAFGDLIAMPVSGAYNLAMESNYNLAQRPAVVFVREGMAQLTRKRQSYSDLIALDALPKGK